MGGYDSARALAVRLIKKKGRPGVRILTSEVGETSDPTQPWKTDAVLGVDPVVAEGIYAAFLDAKEVRGDRGQKSFTTAFQGNDDSPASLAVGTTHVAYVAAADPALAGKELRAGMLIESRGERYLLLESSELRPGDDAVLYTLSLKG